MAYDNHILIHNKDRVLKHPTKTDDKKETWQRKAKNKLRKPNNKKCKI